MTPAVDTKLVSATLKALLLTINGLEGLEREAESEAVRGVLMDFKNWIGTLKEFQENEQLAKLDKVFKAVGWDDQGLRWTCETPDDGEDIFIVEFDDKTRRVFKPL